MRKNLHLSDLSYNCKDECFKNEWLCLTTGPGTHFHTHLEAFTSENYSAIIKKLNCHNSNKSKCNLMPRRRESCTYRPIYCCYVSIRSSFSTPLGVSAHFFSLCYYFPSMLEETSISVFYNCKQQRENMSNGYFMRVKYSRTIN